MSEQHLSRLRSFFIFSRSQSEGYQEHLSGDQRVLIIDNPAVINTHFELLEQGAPVFPVGESTFGAGDTLILVVPEGARSVNTLLDQPIDEVQKRDILVEIGRSLRRFYNQSGLLPINNLGDGLAVSFNAETADTEIYLIPPYEIEKVDFQAVQQDMFSQDVDAASIIWDGWQHV